MARDRTAQPGGESDAAVERIRTLSDRVLEGVRESGEAALQAYERTLRALADYQEAAGQRGPEWVRGLAKAQASLTRELASASPAAARALRDRMDELTGAAVRHAARAPTEEQAEPQARQPTAREQALPISRYDELTATDIVSRLPKLSKSDVGKVAAYERAQEPQDDPQEDRRPDMTSSQRRHVARLEAGRSEVQMLPPRCNEGLVRPRRSTSSGVGSDV